MLRIFLSALRWTGGWCFYVSVVLLVGAALGVASHVAVGLLFMERVDPVYLAAFGLLNGVKYAGIWAGGLAIVLCVMRAHREHEARVRSEGVPAA